MDEILERILNVERRAEEVVQAAQREADEITVKARRDADQLQNEMQKQIAAETAELIQNTENQAQEQKQALLNHADVEMDNRENALSAQMARAVRHARERLAFPRGESV